ncbi:hypothetical protein OG936_32505 [Streptomyces sp. NBC_00846]|nr:hypothetical protein OG936_32505 [Streptomyces sp. NBC_00846]
MCKYDLLYPARSAHRNLPAASMGKVPEGVPEYTSITRGPLE